MWLIGLTLVIGVVQSSSCLTELDLVFNGTFRAGCTCHQTNKDIYSRNSVLQIDAATAKHTCEMDIMSTNFHKANRELRMTMVQTTIKIKMMAKKSHELCEKAELKYIPFGLEDLLPASWECGTNYNDTRAFEDYTRTTDKDGNRIPNIIMLGATGSGKSYYGNGLLGAQNPCPPIHNTIDTNYFGCGKSSESVTRNVKAQHGKYFGDMYSEYGIKPMEVNIYDTPGFFDSDPTQIQQNKRLIAKQLDVEIDAFIFLLGENPRINANTQKIFSTLHQWTLGRVWSNFIVAYGRTTFYHNEMNERAKDNENFIEDQMAKLGEVKDKLWEIAERENWHIRMLNGVDKKMDKTDFHNVKISLLNVAQNKYCNTTTIDGMIRENELCWKTPRREPTNLSKYENSYMDELDDDTYWDIDGVYGEEDEVSYAPDSEYFHIKNMKILQNYILEFMKSPVKTEKEEIKKDLADDVKLFEGEFQEILQTEEQLSEMFNNSGINIDECEQKSKTVLKEQKLEISCPGWSNWESGECSTECGPGSKNSTRMCLDGNYQPIDFEFCQNEYKNDPDYIRDDYCNLGECRWSEWTPGQCSANCGGGTRLNTRHCNRLVCIGSTISEPEACNTHHCEWDVWEIGGSCSKECGTGQQLSTRRCKGTYCVGAYTKMDDCNTHICAWDNLTVSQRTKMRPDTELTTADIIRDIIKGDKESAKKAYCPKCDSRKDLYQLTYSRKCLGHDCSTSDKTFADYEEITIRCELLVPCEWGNWIVAEGECNEHADFTTCNKPSEKISIRTCLGDYCEPEGPFQISTTKKEQCNVIPCEWAKWSSWSSCDKSCESGHQTRTRYCNGTGCIGSTTGSQKCNTQKCPLPTEISWHLDWAGESKYAAGTFGFKVYGKNFAGAENVLLYQRKPSHIDHGDRVFVDGDIGTIILENGTSNGVHLHFEVTRNGKKQEFYCKNCLSSSQSTKLGRLYIDSDMNGNQGISGAANCKNSCTFVRDYST